MTDPLTQCQEKNEHLQEQNVNLRKQIVILQDKVKELLSEKSNDTISSIQSTIG